MADSSATKAPTSPGAGPGAGGASSYLRVTPDKEITFVPTTTTVSKRTLVVANTHPTAPAAFKIKTTAPKQYCVRPNSGRVAAGTSVEVQVMLQALKEDSAAAAATKSKDKFLVQYISLPADVMQLEGDELAARLAELWAQAEQLKKTSPDAAASVLTEKKLRCVFTSVADGDAAAGAEENGSATTTTTTTTSSSSRRRSSSSAPYHAAEFADATTDPPPAYHVSPTSTQTQPPLGLAPAPAPAPAPSASIAQLAVKPTPLPAGPTAAVASSSTLQTQPKHSPPPPPRPQQQLQTQQQQQQQQTHQPDFPSAATLKELLAAREKVKTLQAACEGYKAEIGRLAALRQRRNDTAAAAAGASSALLMASTKQQVSSGIMQVKEEGMTWQLLVLVALFSFVVGAFFF
ncbi:phosphatidylinositol-binding protein scs2 [Geranomyces variabilis]|uniref:Phosphatidylinositol-binding protein scs2 n=1 Tax=Geranomyces variabilis TaxID=109894 RepID=A0AAD5TP37_9FUNG|nr:phosphatidylinositol-binding protein scs2 [Geranomyces variabilis]